MVRLATHDGGRDQDRSASGGLYRIRGIGGELVYVGEGAVRQRLLVRAAKLMTMSAQGRVLADRAPLEFSVVFNARWLRHQRLELETDLIAACVLGGHRPAAQFIG